MTAIGIVLAPDGQGMALQEQMRNRPLFHIEH